MSANAAAAKSKPRKKEPCSLTHVLLSPLCCGLYKSPLPVIPIVSGPWICFGHITVNRNSSLWFRLCLWW